MRTPVLMLVLAAATSNAWAQPCAGLVAQYHLNGDAVDTSGMGNHGAAINAIFEGAVDGLGLVSSPGYIDIPDAPSLNPTLSITMAAWYRPISFSGSGADPIIDKGYLCHCDPYYQYHLSAAGDQYSHDAESFGVNVAVSGGVIAAGTAPGFWTPGQWYHLVSTYDGAAIRLFVNGSLIDEEPATGPIQTFPTHVRIGRFDNLDFWAPGTIDEVHIFNRAISADEVDFLYASPSAEPLVTPAASTVCPGDTINLMVTHLAYESAEYQWRKNGIALENGPTPGGSTISGVTGPELTISDAASGFDDAEYTCTVTTPCAVLTSRPAAVGVLACCADVNDDGSVDQGDVDYLINVIAGGENSTGIDPDFNHDGNADQDDIQSLVNVVAGGGCP